ncbi:MAG: carbon starvation protein A [Pirellulales bacterium]
MQSMPLILGVLAVMAVAYRFYSRFLAERVLGLDDSRPTPAHTLNDGQNYHPTHRWVLFGHHFAAISGAGPLIGPVLAIQFGYLPGLLWLVVGVCLAGAVQDMLVLGCSVRADGKSLAEMARRALGTIPGTLAAIAIFFIVVIALAGLGMVVVKALGGEEIPLAAGTRLEPPSAPTVTSDAGLQHVSLPPGTRVRYTNGAEVARTEPFEIRVPATTTIGDGPLVLPAGSSEQVAGSSWGTFTIACTIPIALAVGFYMYKLRKGHVTEASLLGAIGVLVATVAGNWIPHSPLEPYFSLTRGGIIVAICTYGFVASVLPVWVLLCPRDYISSFLKIGTIGLLVFGVVLANPRLEAPAINSFFAGGGGPYFSGAIFPFVFICIMCGAISGFHALVSSGTTPKMINKESDVRPIGYGGMLMEGLVGVVALIVAASLPSGDYYAINIDLARVDQYAPTLAKMGADVDHLAVMEQQVGGESLRGRTGGAVTLAVGMAKIMTDASQRMFPGIHVEAVIKYWYHFAIMFEALFILTTIDTGTRIARFLLQEILARIHPSFERVDWLPGVILSTGVVTILWGGLIWTGSIDTIWPMFGIANQLLAAIALVVVSTVLVQSGRRRYLPITVLPLAFVTITTITAACQLITGRFWAILQTGLKDHNWMKILQGSLNISCTLFLLIAFAVILVQAVTIWIQPKSNGKLSAQE